MNGSATEVFVYGTLTDPDTAAGVLDADAFEFRGRAVLDGLHRVDGRYPTLAPGGSVEGRILATSALDALDRYEGVADGLYVRVSVPVAAADAFGSDGSQSVEVYVGDPDRLDAPAEWPGTETETGTGTGTETETEKPSFAECVRRYVDDAVTVRRQTFDGFDGFDGDRGAERTDAATEHDEWGIEE